MLLETGTQLGVLDPLKPHGLSTVSQVLITQYDSLEDLLLVILRLSTRATSFLPRPPSPPFYTLIRFTHHTIFHSEDTVETSSSPPRNFLPSFTIHQWIKRQYLCPQAQFVLPLSLSALFLVCFTVSCFCLTLKCWHSPGSETVLLFTLMHSESLWTLLCSHPWTHFQGSLCLSFCWISHLLALSPIFGCFLCSWHLLN